MALHLLIDTSVWLDLIQDYRQQPVISALEDLVERKAVALIVPDVVIDEFSRNKDRVATDAKRSLKSHFALVRDAVSRFGADATKQAAIEALNEADYSAVMKGEAVNRSLERVEKLLNTSLKIPTTDNVKIRAAERALAARAPFHSRKNAIGDAIIIETYADAVAKDEKGELFAFVTSNTGDFSQLPGDQRVPHSDLADLFVSPQSTYWIKLPELIESIDEFILPEMDFEFSGGFSEHRLLSEILEAEHRHCLQVWYNRHWNLRTSIAKGQRKIVTKEEMKTPRSDKQILDTVWAGALEAAKRVETELGPDNLGPWDDFEWGMINGKLSALRWALGEDWDFLDT